MTWLRTAGLALAGILLSVGFSMLGRSRRRQRTAQLQRNQLILAGSDKAKAKAVKAGEKADKFQAHAEQAKAAGLAAIDKAGNDEDMADILDTWRSDSV